MEWSCRMLYRGDSVYLFCINVVFFQINKLNCFIHSPEDFHLALRNNSMAYLLGVRNGNSYSFKRCMFNSRLNTNPVLRSGCICVCLGSGASVHDEIRAACQALCLSNMLKSPSFSQTSKQSESWHLFVFFLKFFFTLNFISIKGLWEMVQKSQEVIDANFHTFLKGELT